MSSLQKFHRRTNGGIPTPSLFGSIGGGNTTVGYYIGASFDGINKLIVAPVEQYAKFGSPTTARGTTNAQDGLANTNTLYAFGSGVTTGHPAAYYCKTYSGGGYNTWYLPAKDELSVYVSASSLLPSAAKNVNQRWYSSSTENDATTIYRHYNLLPINILTLPKSDNDMTYNNVCRPFRRTTT